MNYTSLNMSHSDDSCFNYASPPDVLRTRFYLISIFASSLAAISALENILLVLVFVIQPYFQGTHFVYLAVVAIFDVVHGISYVLTMGVGIMYEYWEDYDLKNVWLSYLMPIFTLSHVMLCSSTYLLVAASMERYLTAHWLSEFCSTRGRLFAIFGAIFVGITTKGSIYFEFQVEHFENCTGDAEYVIMPSALLRDHSYYKLIWGFYYRNIVSIFVPFILLVLLNTGIVLQQKCTVILIEPDEMGVNHIKVGFKTTPAKLECPRGSELKPGMAAFMTNRWVSKAKGRVRKTATRTFVVIIVEHLLLVSLSVFIALWEFIDLESLNNQYHNFYTISTDAISIFTIVACAIRLPTYCICDITFRKELVLMIRGFCDSCERHIRIRARNARNSSQKRFMNRRHRRATAVDTETERRNCQNQHKTEQRKMQKRKSIARELYESKKIQRQATVDSVSPVSSPTTSLAEIVFESMMKKNYAKIAPPPAAKNQATAAEKALEGKKSFLQAVLALKEKENDESNTDESAFKKLGNTGSNSTSKKLDFCSIVAAAKLKDDFQRISSAESEQNNQRQSSKVDQVPITIHAPAKIGVGWKSLKKNCGEVGKSVTESEVMSTEESGGSPKLETAKESLSEPKGSISSDNVIELDYSYIDL